MHDIPLQNTTKLDILGVRFNSKGNSNDHIGQRVRKCRAAYYANVESMSYPGLITEAKSYLWRTLCVPTLLFGCETIFINNTQISEMNTLQGNLIKQFLGLSKRCRTSYLLQALGVPTTQDLLLSRQTNLFKRMVLSNSICSDFYTGLMSRYILNGATFPKTLLGRIVAAGVSPVDLLFDWRKKNGSMIGANGIVDSLRSLLHSPDYNKGGIELNLVRLLLKCHF